MQENTKSVSEFLRSVKKEIETKVNIDVELFKLPNSNSGASLSIGDISSVEKTGDLFKVKLNILCECFVSLAEVNPELVATEISMNIQEVVSVNSFGCTARPPENLANAPMGDDDKSYFRGLTWDQELYVERFDIKAP